MSSSADGPVPEDLDRHLPAIAAGDPDAFARWVAGAEAPLRRSLARFAAGVDTEAVVQETLLRAWSVAAKCEHDGRPNGLLRLALTIARHLAISELRRYGRVDRRRAEELLREPQDSAPAPMPDPLLRAHLEECRRQLPDKPAAALRARLVRSTYRPDRDLARSLDMQLNTFLQNVTRARRLLAECLRRRHVDLEAELS